MSLGGSCFGEYNGVELICCIIGDCCTVLVDVVDVVGGDTTIFVGSNTGVLVGDIPFGSKDAVSINGTSIQS